MLRVQIRNKPRLNRSPSHPFPRQRAGGRAVDAKEATDPAKMIGGFLARFADDRYVQAPADCLRNLSSRDTLVGHSVIPCSGGTLLKHEPVKPSSIDPMHRRPVIKTVADKCGNSLFSRNADQVRYKAMITVAVYRWGKAQYRCADSACRQRQRRLFRLAQEVGIRLILFGCERAFALNEQAPASNDQRTVRARKRAAESLDGTLIRFRSRPVVVEVVYESGMDHAVGCCCATAK